MTTPRKDAAMSATATVHPDGSGTLILDGTEPHHLPAAEVATTRAALMALIQQQAATAGQSIAVVAAEPSGTCLLYTSDAADE